jgi:protein-tyrosine phosphatase
LLQPLIPTFGISELILEKWYKYPFHIKLDAYEMTDKKHEYPVRWITTELAVGYAPRSNNDLATIRAQGITTIVNLCAECYDLHDTEQNAGFNVYYIPIPDEEAPTFEELEKALSWVAACIDSGKKVLVHCRFGIGRTGTFVVAYLLSKGFSLKAALQKMKHTPSIPMSRNQWDLLDRYTEKLGASKVSVPEFREEIEQPTDSFFKKWEAMLDWFKE